MGNRGGCFNQGEAIHSPPPVADCLNFGLSDYYQPVNQVKFFPLDLGTCTQFNIPSARILDAWVELLAEMTCAKPKQRQFHSVKPAV